MWEYREERGQFYLHQFLPGQPDLNYRNPKILEEIKDVFRFWLDLGVDGFRMDAVSLTLPQDRPVQIIYGYMCKLYLFPRVSNLLLSESNIVVKTSSA